ncbi:hypothetical protein IAQ61_005965 [Plenodomus lingam]|uniref:uncharacterized protein n=1 Tax=Leptosphaeria maculans TaxID=5022 RepID=UPI0033165EDD|nr:hypothetical protein IAQ61_005965 [Plenodomus lingam]
MAYYIAPVPAGNASISTIQGTPKYLQRVPFVLALVFFSPFFVIVIPVRGCVSVASHSIAGRRKRETKKKTEARLRTQAKPRKTSRVGHWKLKGKEKKVAMRCPRPQETAVPATIAARLHVGRLLPVALVVEWEDSIDSQAENKQARDLSLSEILARLFRRIERPFSYPVGLPVSIADSGVITSIAIHCPKLRARSPHRLSKHINWPAVLVLLSGPHLPPALSTKGVIGRPGPGCTVSIQPGDTAQRSGLAVSTRIPRRWPLWTLIKNSLAE